MTISDAALSEIANAGFDPVYGARPLKRAIQAQLENPLAKQILEGRFAAEGHHQGGLQRRRDEVRQRLNGAFVKTCELFVAPLPRAGEGVRFCNSTGKIQMKYIFLAPSNSSSPWRKLPALIATVVLVGLVLMFSAVLLAILVLVGAVAWAYLWWKTREVRKQMREFRSREMGPEIKANDGEVFEGQVIKVVDIQHERQP